MKRFSKYIPIAIDVLLIFGFVILAVLYVRKIEDYHQALNKLAESEQKRVNLERIIYQSEYYTKMAQIVWGKEARRCDAGLILKVANLIKEIDTTLNVEVILSVITIESGFNSYAVSSANALGLMQVKYETAREIDSLITKEDLFNDDINLRVGIKYLSKLKKRFEGNLELALLAYNRGPTRLMAELKEGNLERKYQNKVQKYKMEAK